MNFHFASQLLLRMPVKTPAAHTDDAQLFLEDQLFLAALSVATNSFYSILKRKQFRVSKLSGKELYSLQKYINRYCFRPTPFGLFASVSLADWRAKTNAITSARDLRAHVEAAMPVQNLISYSLLSGELKSKTRFESNPSIYRMINEYRFFRTGLDETGKKRAYQLQSIAFSKILKDLISKCSIGCSWLEIVSHIAIQASCTINDAEDYADFLIDAQLLVNCERLTITGSDQLSRLMLRLEESQLKRDLRTALSRQQTKQPFEARLIEQMEDDLQNLLAPTQLPHGKLNIILKQDSAEELNISLQGQIRDGLHALEILMPAGPPEDLSQFIRSFQKSFEGQTIALLQALDPEAGVGYQSPETEKFNPLLETLYIPYKSRTTPNGSWSPTHRIMMECWLRERSDNTVIRLQEADLQRIKKTENPEPMLGMSVLFRIADNQVFIESAGGINAPALMGRFTIADDRIAAAARSMARQIEGQNPDIIFAELLHLADPHTDNVNRRAHIYQYELPITAGSTLPARQQLQLSDLYIRIIENKVMIFSEQHQKFVIPRLTSAYNHGLDKLPLFRFLADLPYQYGRSNLSFNLQQLYPGLQFYPRVEYKDTILSLATWIITEQQIEKLIRKPDLSGDNFTQFSRTLRLPRFFSIVEGDQELVYDRLSKRDTESIYHFFRNKKEVVIKEFLNQPEIKQYNAFLLPNDPVALPKLASPKASTTGKQRKYVPGSSWLYLKIYAPKIGINRLILQLAPLLEKRYAGHKISQWFFTRYEDHAPHIRLRLKIDPLSINQILLAFKTKLEDRIQQHVIREFQIDVYSRELERYAAGGIENTEHFFWASSELVLNFLKQSNTTIKASSHAFALYSTKAIIESFIPNINEQIIFTSGSYEQFLKEFTDEPFKVALDKKYRELNAEILKIFSGTDPGLLSGSVKAGRKFQKSLRNIKNGAVEKSGETAYLRSIIHMHLNRIFTDESRKQEMICYYLLYKYLLSLKARNKKPES